MGIRAKNRKHKRDFFKNLGNKTNDGPLGLRHFGRCYVAIRRYDVLWRQNLLQNPLACFILFYRFQSLISAPAISFNYALVAVFLRPVCVSFLSVTSKM